MTTSKQPRKKARKRGAGEGSVYQLKDGSWRGSIMVGRKPDGRPDRRTVYGRTRQEAVSKLDIIRRQFAAGSLPSPHRQTLGEYLERWLRVTVAPSVSPGTLRVYGIYMRAHVIPRIGHLRLSELRPVHFKEVLTALLEAGKSPTYVHHIHGALHAALEVAVHEGELAANPLARVKPPARRVVEMQALDANQARQFLAAVEAGEHRLAPLWRLMIDSGCRIGEALALAWPDTDLDRGGIRVRSTLAAVHRGVPVLKEPKTPKSRRMVTLTPATVASLRAHRARQLEERLAAGSAYATHNLVFANAVGGALRRDYVLAQFRRALRSAGLPVTMRLHDLRHSGATIMLQANVPAKVAADRLGHSNVGITLNRYSHVTPGIEADAVARIALALGG